MGELLRYVVQLFLRLLVLLSVVGQRCSPAFLVQPSPVHKDTADILTPSSSSTVAFLDLHLPRASFVFVARPGVQLFPCSPHVLLILLATVWR